MRRFFLLLSLFLAVNILQNYVFAQFSIQQPFSGENLPKHIPEEIPPVHVTVIHNKYKELGGASGFLGQPLGKVKAGSQDGYFQEFQGGSIYWTADTGAHEVHGAIRDKWKELGWEKSFLGYPITDESKTYKGIGRFNHFQGGSIYWSPADGSVDVNVKLRIAKAEPHKFCKNDYRVMLDRSGSYWKGDVLLRLVNQGKILDEETILATDNSGIIGVGHLGRDTPEGKNSWSATVSIVAYAKEGNRLFKSGDPEVKINVQQYDRPYLRDMSTTTGKVGTKVNVILTGAALLRPDKSVDVEVYPTKGGGPDSKVRPRVISTYVLNNYTDRIDLELDIANDAPLGDREIHIDQCAHWSWTAPFSVVAAVGETPQPPPESGTGSQPSGFSALYLWNCNTDKRAVNVWIEDLTKNTAQQKGPIIHQYDDFGTCPKSGSLPTIINFEDGHVYRVIVVDTQKTGCGTNDPHKLACQRTAIPAVRGDKNGPPYKLTSP